MTTYEYACDECGDFITQAPIGEAPEEEECAGCHQLRPRRYSMAPTTIMHEHWNLSAQAPISSMRKFEDHLKADSEAATLRTGIEHNFVPIDVHDPSVIVE